MRSPSLIRFGILAVELQRCNPLKVMLHIGSMPVKVRRIGIFFSALAAVFVLSVPTASARTHTQVGALIIPAGDDSFHVDEAEFDVELPLDLFGTGSEPFNATITCGGEDVGQADTIVKRLSDIPLPPGGTDTVPIELVALKLVSCQPIVVNFGDGSQQEWSVRVDLSEDQMQTGEIFIERDRGLGIERPDVNPPFNFDTILPFIEGQGGTFDIQLPVEVSFTFTPVEGVVVTPDEEEGSLFERGEIIDEEGELLDGEAEGISFDMFTFWMRSSGVSWSICESTTSGFCPDPMQIIDGNSFVGLVPLTAD